MTQVQTLCRCGKPVTHAIVSYVRSTTHTVVESVEEIYELDDDGNLADRLEREEEEIETEEDEPEITDRETQYVCDECEAE